VAALLRSVLFVPGIRPDRFERAVLAGADAVVFDLEDSVDPARKAEARRAVGQFLGAPRPSGPLLLVRVNGAGTTWHRDDVTFAAGLAARPGVVVPKAEAPDTIAAVAAALRGRALLPLVETARGVLNAASLAAAAPVPAVLFGAEDLTAEVGVPRTLDGEELLFARSQVVLAATAAGADAIDAVFTALEDLDGLRRDASRARALGFRGKMAVHPDQIPVIHDVFTPSAADVAHARRVVEAFDAAEARGEGVIRLDGRMIDAPVVARARRVLGAR